MLFASPEVVHRPRSDSLLHFGVRNILQIRMEKKMLALGVCFAQTCTSAGRMLAVEITRTLLMTNSFVSTTKNSMKCLVNWIALRICVRSRNTQPHLKGGPEPLEKQINSSRVRNVRTDFRTLFLDLVQNIYSVRFSYLFRLNTSLRPHRTCKSSRRSARR